MTEERYAGIVFFLSLGVIITHSAIMILYLVKSYKSAEEMQWLMWVNFKFALACGLLLKIYGFFHDKIRNKNQNLEWKSKKLFALSLFELLIFNITASSIGWSIIFCGIVAKSSF